MARKTKVTVRNFDPAEILKTEEDMALYLEEIMADGADDPALIAAALGDIARARGMTQLARETGLSREGLYQTLAPGGNPSLSTVIKVMKAMGLRLSAKAA